MRRSKWKAFSEFSSPERWLLGRLWVHLLLVDWGLRTLPFRTLRGWAQEVRAGRKGCNPERLAYLLDITARHHIYPMTCLRKGLVLQRFLGCHGVVSHLRIGVRKEQGEFHSHAWVELPDRTFGYAFLKGCEFLPLQSAREPSLDSEK